MTKELLLAEVEDLLRTMPPSSTIRHPTDENFCWLGRLSAVIANWSPPKALFLTAYLTQLRSRLPDRDQALPRILTLLHEARHDLLMQTRGPVSVAVPSGMVFDYFDEIRKIIEIAKHDLLFVDPYLDAEFVSRYLGHVADGVTTRLLAREKLPTLLPAVDAFAQQSKSKIEVRSASGFHDRYIFVDKTACYQSGASFKDGAKKAPTTLTQITDAFAPVLQAYEDLWGRAKVER
jgi:hypothetical protein